jgi:hypothetical protein
LDEKNYTFDYICTECKNVSKFALIIKCNKNELVGIHMKKDNNKGILIKGIIKEIQNYQINNKIGNSHNKICIIDNKALSQFKEKEIKVYNKNQNDNENYINRKIDSLEVEEKLYLNNKYNKLNKDNSNLSVMKKRSLDKKNQPYFDKNKNDNSIQNIDNINNFDNKKNISNSSNNSDINKLIYEEKEKKSNLKDLKNGIVDNKIYEENNDLKKQTNSQDIQNSSEKNDKCNKNLNNIDKNGEIGKEISLYFLFKNGKELYLDVEDSCTFEQVIGQLNKKYLWLKNIEIKEYIINNESICKNKTAKENNLINNSKIYIIEYP